MVVIRRFFQSSDKPVENRGNVVPRWKGNYLKENWWTTKEPTYYSYSLSNDDLYVQLGGNKQGWASAVFYGEEVKVLEEEQLDDGSLKVKISYKGTFYASRRSDFATTGVRSENKCYIGGELAYQNSGLSTDEYTFSESKEFIKTVIIAPEGVDKSALFEIVHKYPNGEFPDSTIKLGIELYNPNPPSYIPMSVRKGGEWKSLNKNNGKIKVRKNGTWVDISKENFSTQKQENKGHNRVRKGGKMLQMPPM